MTSVQESPRSSRDLDRARIMIQGLTKRFGSLTAVDNVSLEIEPGSFTSLLGPSGCGKTTTLNILAGLEEPDEGTIVIGETTVYRDGSVLVPANRRNIGMVFQSYALWPQMTVEANIAFPLRMRKVAAEEIRERVEAVLAMVGMEGYNKRLPSQLSGGQQQRVALARAFVYNPPVLLLDEPLSNLDAKLRTEMRLEIRELHDRIGTTTVYVTHDQEEAMTMSDTIVVMSGGRVQQVGKPEDIYFSPTTNFVAQFVGKSNALECEVEGADPAGLRLRMLGGRQVCVPKASGHPKGTPIRLHVRPEQVTMLTSPPDDLDESTLWLEGTVRRRVFVGRNVEYSVYTPESESFVVDVSSHFDPHIAPGTAVWLGCHRYPALPVED